MNRFLDLHHLVKVSELFSEQSLEATIRVSTMLQKESYIFSGTVRDAFVRGCIDERLLSRMSAGAIRA